MASMDNRFARSSTARFGERQSAARYFSHPIHSHQVTCPQPPAVPSNTPFSFQPALSKLSQSDMPVQESRSSPDPMVQSSSRLIPTVPLNLSSLASGQFAYPGVSNPTSSVSNSTALELLVPSHPFGDLHPCRNGRLCGSVPGVACSACLLEGIDNPYFPLIPLDRLPLRNPSGRRGLQLILDEKLSILYRCLRHEQTYCKLQRDKGFNKSTISRIVNDPKVKKWLARVLVVYPEDESFYRWLRIILHPCKTPRDLKKPKTPKTPKDSKAFKKLKKPKRSKKSNESLYQEWWDFISTD